MANPAKARRQYDSPRRREQAIATRRQILKAAQHLFERDGYTATSMAAIAREAGVALKTVYVVFESKSGLLRALWHQLLRGDQAQIPVGEQPWFRELLDERDPVRQLRLNARNSLMVKDRAGALMQVIGGGADGDADVRALWNRIQKEFYENQRLVVRSLHEKKALRDGLDVGRAADILWSLNHPTLYWNLVGERGWSSKRFEKWLADLFRDQLLA